MHGIDFQRAKVDHYLTRAQEYVQMGRYLAARKPLEQVFSLDPANGTGRTLQRTIEHSLESLSRRGERLFDAGLDLSDDLRRTRRQELILIVDQDEQLLLDLATSLRRYGFRVVSAGSYREAVDALSFMNPHLIISEVNFEEGAAGFDLYRWVRTNSKSKDAPFLFLATHVNREMLIAGKRLGVNDFILKPLDEDVVYASIVSCFSHSKAQQERK